MSFDAAVLPHARTTPSRPHHRRIGAGLAASAVAASLMVAAPATPATAAPATSAVVTAARPAAVAVAPATIRVARVVPTASQRRAVALRAAAAKRARAVSIAWAQVGDRYRAGMAGPSAFDCSGLTTYVWRRAAGRNLPHYSRAQFASLPRVSRSNLRPGDLVFFFGRGAHHVGIYVGGGRMVHAANPRRGVIVSKLSERWYAQRFSGARRVV